ncbi:MAG: sigma 54-interacting transcriptional regulator [Bacillota bacterium]
MKLQIGVISPYDEFTELVQHLAAEISLPVKVEQAVLANGVAIARRWEAEGFQLIIGRGPTAVMMRKVLRIPVVMINITAFDVMDALHKARQMGQRIAFADYDLKRRPYDLGYLGEMLGLDFTPLLYRDIPDLKAQISQAARQGYDVVVGTGSCVPPMVEEKGMKGVLVQSSREAVQDALRQAKELMDLRLRDSARAQMAQAILDTTVNGIIALDADRRVSVFNRAAERLFGVKEASVKAKSLDELRSEHGFIHRLVGNGQASDGEVVKVGSSAYVSTRWPIRVGDSAQGLVVIFQGASEIQQWEAKIRKELSTKGLVARYSFRDIRGSSPAIVEAVAKAKTFARTDLTVLISGESGTGKELFAQAMHQESAQREGPFVAINCAALPESLLESELFGYEEGAFTGARKGGAPGLFEVAHGGTLFLDEIGEMPISLQARLLRALQERRVRRVGGHRVVPVEVRVIAATNRNLIQAVRDGKFRDDLYYRLNVLHLEVPSLRQRMDDLKELAEYFLAQLGAPPMPAAVYQTLRTYSWPGNVRELGNFLQKYAVLVQADPDVGTLAGRLIQEMKRQSSELKLTEPDGKDTLTITLGTLDQMEGQILTTLDAVMGYDRTKLARRLGISRTTLWKKLKDYEDRPDSEQVPFRI